MSRKYKFHKPEGMYFVSFATVEWIDVFTREDYCHIIVDSLNHCVQKKGMCIFSWVLMSNHMHLLFKAAHDNPSQLLGKFKEFTSKAIRKAIASNPKESRKSWLLNIMQAAAAKNSSVSEYQFWQHHNQPLEIFSFHWLEQKINYIHNNPVKAGYVVLPEHLRYSSAIDFYGGKGLVQLEPLYV